MAVETARIRIEQPAVETARPKSPEWGSDVVAELLRRLAIPYIALNPGASYRGLHDSLVNYNGNHDPSMILCNHEEVAVGIAHGYAKLRGRAMAAAIHSNVGLMHATMAIFNAFEDRAPMLLVGGNGPMDATQRRPWIDWVHTTHGQGELVREFTKWEHQPTSIAAIPEALLRAWQAAHLEPPGPAYVDLDAGLQEAKLSEAVALPEPADFPLPAPPAPAQELIEQAALWLTQAQQADVLREGDVVLALDRNDPAGTLRAALGQGGREARASIRWPRLINVSLEPLRVSSWVADYQELPRAGLPILSTPDAVLTALVPAVRKLLRDNAEARRRTEQRTQQHRARRIQLEGEWAAQRERRWNERPISIVRAVSELRSALGERYEDAVLAYMPTAWPSGVWDFLKPGAYLGGDGGAGIGAGPPITVGAALAAEESARPVIGMV